MKTLLLACVIMVSAVVGWESEPPKKYHGPLHYPVIHKGVPVDTAEVQHATAAHLEALSAAETHHGHHQENHYESGDHHHHHDEHSHYKTEVEHVQHKYHGKLHYPKIYKGVPVDTPEVQHAREAHLSALENANHGGSYEEYHHEAESHHVPEHKYHGPLHYPKIYKGVPVDTPEVQHAREEHLSALQNANHGGSYEEYHHEAESHHVPEHKYHGPLHYPKIYKGVPVDTPEVQHAREEHLSALENANHGGSYEEYHHEAESHHEPEQKYHGPLHYPKIYKGVPIDTPEVQHAREEHLSAVSHASHHGNHHY